MNRRDALRALLATLAVSPAGLPHPAFGQARVPRIALLTGGSGASLEESMKALREGMTALGYEEGRNFTFDPRFGDYDRERTGKLTAEVIGSKPDILITQGAVLIAVAPLTKTIPVIAMFSGDMVDIGIIKSLSRPGANVTGIQYFAIDLVGKRIELLKEIVPTLKRIAVIADPGHPVLHLERDAAMAAATKLGMSVAYFPVKNPKEELDAALAAARAAGAEALVMFPDAVTFQGRERIAAFALQHKLPTVSGWGSFAVAGHLVTYGPNLRSSWVRLAGHVDRVLKGADPGTLPVELPTIIELIVNRKTANALGVKIPQSVLLRADRVIE
jgi:putative ABC transport system substrate-binding protein